MVVDHVYCGKCGKKMYINLGAETCPFCGEWGALQYVNKDEPDVELNYELKNMKYVGVVNYNSTTKYSIDDTEEGAIQKALCLVDSEEIGGYDVEEIYYEEV